MKRNVILIIIAAVVVAALAGVMIFVLNLPQTDEQGLTSDELDILIYDKTSVKPEQIKVSNSGGEYTVIGYDYSSMIEESSIDASEESGQTSENRRKSDVSSVKINMRYTMQDYEDLELSKDNTDALAYQCSYVAALQLVDKSGSKYAEYGLDKPLSTVTVDFSDGTGEKLYIGKKAPNDMGYYFRREASKNVYLLNSDSVSSFLIEKLQMFDKTITKAFNDDEETKAEISSISISGEGYEKPLEIDQQEDISIAAVYKIRSPYLLACAKSAAVDFGKMMYGMKGTEVAAAMVTDADKKKFGLDKPYMDIKVKSTDDTSVNIIVSKAQKDGSCYVMADDGKIIFKLLKSDVEDWYGTAYDKFITIAYIYPNMDYLDKAVITADGKASEFDIVHERAKNELLEDYTITTVTTGDGKTVGYPNFSTFIRNLTGLLRTGTEVRDTAGYSEIFKTELSYSKQGEKSIKDVLTIKKGADGSCIVYLNDMLLGYTDRKYAEKLAAQTDKVSGEAELENLLSDTDDENVEESSAESSGEASAESSSEASAESSAEASAE